jgi:AcrR family transcriptional regulator
MGTPRDSEATKRSVIDAAGRLFAAKGFSGVTAREVAADAGVALSAIPYHFGSMEALYREALLAACEISPDAAPLAERALREEPEVGLRTAIRWAIADTSSVASPWALRLLDREEANPSPVYEEVLRIKVVPEWNWLREVVARASGREPDSQAVKFGVVAMYDLTASLNTRGGLIDHLAADVVGAISRDREAYIECMSRLTLAAVTQFAEQMSAKKSATRVAGRGRRPAGSKAGGGIKGSPSKAKGRKS